jgi:hypothetical protein
MRYLQICMRRPARAVKSSFQLQSVTIFGFVLETAGCPAERILLSKDDRRRWRRLQLKAPNLLECGKQRVLWVKTHTHILVRCYDSARARRV